MENIKGSRGGVLLIQVPPEGRPADAQLFGGKGLIAAAVGESLVDGGRDNLIQCFPAEGILRRGGSLHMMEGSFLQQDLGDRIVQDVRGGSQGRQLAQHCLELGEIVRPAVMDELIHGIGGKTDDLLAKGGVQAV